MTVSVRDLGVLALISFVAAATPGCSADAAVTHAQPAAPGAVAGGPFALGQPLVYELDADDAEVVALASADRVTRLFVSSPGAACGGRGEPSFLSSLAQQCELPLDLEEAALLDLGLGEVTSVAAHPRGDFAVVARKNARTPDSGPGSLDAVAGDRVVGTVAVGIGPDSVAIAPNGRYAVVACEAQEPDAEDCPEDAASDAGGSIVVVDLRGGPSAMTVAAVIDAREMFDRFFKEEGDRASAPELIEPEFVAIAPDSSYALVTLQEQSAVAVVTLRENGDAAGALKARLADVVFLPHEFRDAAGYVRGVHPDGIAISPDGAFALTANEAHSKARHLQGLSVLDLREGPGRIRVAGTHAVFTLDPSLGASTAKKATRTLKKERKRGSAPVRPPKKEQLPRLDPEGIALVRCGGRTLAALAIERKVKLEDAGSVLLLDVTDSLSGAVPVRVGRRTVGATEYARPETLVFSGDGRYLFVASEGDGGTLTMIQIGA